MEHRTLGNTGLRTSLLGLGCINFGLTIDQDRARAVVHKALELGVTLFDNSDSYGDSPGRAEEFLGACLGDGRKDVVIITKFSNVKIKAADGTLKPARNASRRHIMLACEASLKRLKTDWIDVYMLHFPDPQTPMEETLRAL